MASYVAHGARALPGLAVSVIKGGSPVCRSVWGARKKGSPEAVAIDDAFHIGSDTKAMTSILCGIAVDRGLLSRTSAIGSVLGRDFPMRDEYRGVSLETLLSQWPGFRPACRGIPGSASSPRRNRFKPSGSEGLGRRPSRARAPLPFREKRGILLRGGPSLLCARE
jgi:CubicO group peptidase (beta-lactamase class C family)